MTEASRMRIGGSKVRTGCVTCKARRVKCDETKPHCSRCVKGGRECKGYAEPLNRSSDQLRIINYVAPNSRSVSPYPQAESREIRALQYFKTCTAPELAGVFSSDIWDRFMLRLAYHQSAVHHALVALGTVHEDFTRSALAHSDFSQFANQEYGKAIRDVLQLSASNSTMAVEIALATCIVFSCLESLRGHYQSSLSHLISGLNVLEEEQRKGTANHDQPCIPRELLLSLFIRMDLQRLDLGVADNQPGIMLLMPVRNPIPPCFSSLDEAQYQLDILHHQIIQHLYWVEQATIDYGDSTPPEIWDGVLAQRAAMETLRQSWENALNAMVGRDPATAALSPGSRDPALLILDMENTALRILLHVDPINTDLDFDNYDDLFHSIVCDADEYIQRTADTRPASQRRSPSATPSTRNSPDSSFAITTSDPASHSAPALTPILSRPEPTSAPLFTVSLSCVPFLYLCSARCRNPRIRHRALSLLRKCNRREILWDSAIAANVAGRIIAIEEALALAAVEGTRSSPGAGTSGSPQARDIVIPNELRVKHLDIKFGSEGHGKVVYAMEVVPRPPGVTGQVPCGVYTNGFEVLFEW